MTSTSDSRKLFKIEVITEKDNHRIQQFLNQHYFGQGPVSACLNREANKESAVEEHEYTSIDIIAEGLSLMATTPSEQIVGLALNSNKHRDETANPIKCNENTAKVINLLKQLKAEMDSLGKSQTLDEKGMTAQILAVHPEWRNKGIGALLWERTRELAEQKGFTQIQSTCSSAYSASILEKFGFQCLHSIRYEDYKENGKIVIKPDPPHTHIKYMVWKI